MEKPIQFKRNFPFFLFFLCIFVFISTACKISDLECWYRDSDCVTTPEAPTPSSFSMVQTYANTGQADITYEYSNVPTVKTNLCHDTLSDAVINIYPGQAVPANAGFTRTLTKDEYYFSAEIHSALVSPWRDKKCVYADDKDMYELFQINGVYNHENAVFTPLYTNHDICPNAAKFVPSGTEIFLTYDCVVGPTTYHFSFDLPLKSASKP